jgi:hypothetical protein
MSSRKRKERSEDSSVAGVSSSSSSSASKQAKLTHTHAVQSDTILSIEADTDSNNHRHQAFYRKSVPFRMEHCTKWTTHDTHLTEKRRKQIHDQVDYIMSRKKAVHWIDVSKQLFALYDRLFLDGELGRMLDHAKVSIQVITIAPQPRQMQMQMQTRATQFQLHLHIDALESLQFPASVCGIVKIGLLYCKSA